MLANMATSLILHKRIKTTTAKAKALRVYVEPLITKSKDDSTHSRRVVFSYLQNKEAVSELFREVSPKVSDRPGGYTRILKTGTRLGDNAEMCVIELVDYNENLLSAKEETKAKSGRRRRRGGKKKDTGEAPQVTAGTETQAEIVEEVKTTETEEPSVEVKSKPSETEVKETKAEETEASATDTDKVIKDTAETEEVEVNQEESKAEVKEDKKEQPKEEASPEVKKEDVKSETSTDKQVDEAEDKKEEK